MTPDVFLKELDQLFREKKMEEADAWICQNRQQAILQSDNALLLSVLNEEIGFARSRGEHERSCQAFEDARQLMEQMGLPEGIHRATTLLNGATAYRAAGSQKKALEFYQEAEQMYRSCGITDQYENASLFNNMSILYEEMGMLEAAVSCLEKARKILEQLSDCQAELATTDTNLGMMYLRRGERNRAFSILQRAKKAFEDLPGEDPHYWSVLGALAQICYENGNYIDSIAFYEKAIDCVQRNFGRNDAFFTYCDSCIMVCEQVGAKEAAERVRRKKEGFRIPGLELSRRYYEECAKELLKTKVPEDVYERMTVGLAGQGSECFGYDDAISEDHDFGPAFCIWMEDADMERCGNAVMELYASLPGEFLGFKGRNETKEGNGRIGVLNTKEFYRGLIGMDAPPKSALEWLQIPEEWLAAASNGAVFKEGSGSFMEMRRFLLSYYPEDVRLKKIAARAAVMAQAGQYNYSRAMMRRDYVGAQLAVSEFLKAAGSMIHLLNRKYMPYYKWMHRSLKACNILSDTAEYMEELAKLAPQEEVWKDVSLSDYQYRINVKDHRVVYIETICRRVREALTEEGLITGNSAFLQDHLQEILSNIKDDTLRNMHVMIG